MRVHLSFLYSLQYYIPDKVPNLLHTYTMCIFASLRKRPCWLAVTNTPETTFKTPTVWCFHQKVILQDVFRVDYVVMDEYSQAVDNNRAQDYSLPLVGALTEEQIIEKQAAALAAFEARRLQVRPHSARF